MAVVSPHSRSARFFVLSPDRGLDRLEQLRRKHFDPEHQLPQTAVRQRLEYIPVQDTDLLKQLFEESDQGQLRIVHTVVVLETLALEQKVVERNNTVVVECTVLGTGTAEVAVMVLVDIRRDSFSIAFPEKNPEKFLT